MKDALPQSSEEIFDRISEGVVVLDKALTPSFANAAARQMLGIQDPTSLPRLPSDDLLSIARRGSTGEEVEDTIKLYFPTARTVRVRATAIGDGLLLTLEDVTEEFLAQQVRREFVTHASHELKTPVASIQALAGAIRQAIEDDPNAAATFSDRLMGEASRLGRLIKDLLDLSRLEDPESSPFGPVDLSQVVEHEADEARPEAEAKSMNLELKAEPGVRVRGDWQQLALLVRNLLENALRYSPEGGRVGMEVCEESGEAVVRVIDNGIGIPTEAQGRVFERFYRVDRARSRDRGGTGLGLAIVKHVAELHGGSVTVNSELGRGSVFTARLPTLQPSDGDGA